MAAQTAALNIVLHHPSAESYARLIGARFPQVRTIVAPDPDQLEQCIGEADVLLASYFPVEVFDRATKLRWFQSTAAGIDSILPIRDRISQIRVTNARGIHGEIIADFVMAGVTMLHWNVPRLFREQVERKWAPRPVAPLSEMTLGLVGLGSIGKIIALRAKSAGMSVVGVKRDISTPIEGVDRLFAPDALQDLLPICDFVALAVPSTQDTVGLIGAAQIARIQPHAFLINIARGNVVVQDDLIKALQTGAIAGAMLDVFEREPLPDNSPLWDMPNVIVTPHVAGSPTNFTERMFSIFGDNIERFLNGQELSNVVDIARGY